MIKVAITGALAFVLFVPGIVRAVDAQAPIQSANSGIQSTGSGIQSTGSKPAPVAAREGLQNPLKGADSLGELFNLLAQFAIDVAYVVIAAFLLLSGFKFVKAQGNPDELSEAKRTFWYTIVGAMIIIGMDTMISVFKRVLDQLGS